MVKQGKLCPVAGCGKRHSSKKAVRACIDREARQKQKWTRKEVGR